MYEAVKAKLKIHPEFRERQKRAMGLCIMALRANDLEEKEKLTREELIDFATSYSSYDREWRQVLKDEPTLRGADYEDKVVLEQEREINLGYEAGFNKKII